MSIFIKGILLATIIERWGIGPEINRIQPLDTIDMYKLFYPITKAVLEKMLAVNASNLRGLRDRALLLLAYDFMRRRSELVLFTVKDMR